MILDADLATERPIAAEKGTRRIVVEIKSLLGRSLITEFYSALGQYLTYKHLLEKREPDREMFLTVSSLVFNDFFQIETIKDIVQTDKVSILTVNIKREEIEQWINWQDTET